MLSGSVPGAAANSLELVIAQTRAINTVCGKVGLRTVAEFVETEETLDKLREIGVDYVQGFGIARREPIDKLS